MKNMKKVLKVSLAVLLVAVLMAGVASAVERRGEGRRGEGRRNREPQRREWQNKELRSEMGYPMRRMMGGGMMRNRAIAGTALEVPQEIREKWAEAQKIMIDLRMELGRNPINREKALELHAKHRALMQEIHDWRFAQQLDALTTR